MTSFFILSLLSGLSLASEGEVSSGVEASDGEARLDLWCPDGTTFDSTPLSWTAADLATYAALYGYSYPDPTDQAQATTETWCAENYSLAALQSSGVSVLVQAASSPQQGLATSSVMSENPLVFVCEMCGYRPEDIIVDPPEPKREGMTWVRKAIDPVTGTVTVGCDSGTCDPYQGDTDCTQELPLLCAYDLGSPVPASVSTSLYYQWSGNVVATTPPVSPVAAGLSTIGQADDACATEFGPGWRVAEFHDGWAWNFLAHGNTGSEPRFWVDINDQPNGTCWTH